mgnify:CR=1 FL=1
MMQRLVSSILMSLFLSFVMSCWVTWLNLGWNEEFVTHWMTAFRFAWPAAWLAAFLLGPLVHLLTQKLLKGFSGLS